MFADGPSPAKKYMSAKHPPPLCPRVKGAGRGPRLEEESFTDLAVVALSPVEVCGRTA
jgi:hypothetical protein